MYNTNKSQLRLLRRRKQQRIRRQKYNKQKQQKQQRRQWLQKLPNDCSISGSSIGCRWCDRCECWPCQYGCYDQCDVKCLVCGEWTTGDCPHTEEECDDYDEEEEDDNDNDE